MTLTETEVADILDHLAGASARGVYSPPNVQKWPFDQALDAYLAVSQPSPHVKHVRVTA